MPATPAPAPQPWMAPAWRAPIEAWIRAGVERQGLTVTGAIAEVHRRPWSLVLRVPTSGGACYAKATVRGLEHEARQVQILAEVVPGLLPPLLAIEPQQGWLLTRDAGTSLRDLLRTDPDPTRWQTFVRAYAIGQQRTTASADRLLAAGCFDRRPDRLRAPLEALLARLPTTGDAALSDTERRLVPQALEALDRAAAQLTAGPIRPSIQADDLHGSNVYDGPGGTTVIDWGDACIAHPFGSLLILERRLAEDLGVRIDAPVIRRVRASYLDAWRAALAPDALAQLVTLACWTGLVARALTWDDVLRAAGPDHARARATSVTGKVQAWLAAPFPS